jgi:hypothetical protein
VKFTLLNLSLTYFSSLFWYPRKTWMEGVQEAMTARNLEQDEWRNREERRLVCGRQ